MTAKMPPVPPDNAPKKGAGSDARPDPDTRSAADPRDRNLAEQGRQGNIKQNTTHKGHQQDR